MTPTHSGAALSPITSHSHSAPPGQIVISYSVPIVASWITKLMPTGIAQPTQNHKTTQKQNCFLLKWFVSLLASMMQRQKQVFHKDNDLYATIIPFSATILSSILIFWRLSVGMWRSRFLVFFYAGILPPVISVVGNPCYLIQEFHLGIVRLPTIFHPLFIQLFQLKRYRVLGNMSLSII